MAVVSNLKQVRTAHKQQQKDVAVAIGTCSKTISNIERGQHCPSLEIALRIAKYMQVPVEELFQVDESVEPIKKEDV